MPYAFLMSAGEHCCAHTATDTIDNIIGEDSVALASAFPDRDGEVVDGVMYGRGSTDNKSGVLAFNKAAKAFLAVRGEVPVNLKFLIEGEEEIGSVNLETFLRSAADRLACDAVIVSDTGMLGIDIPSIGTGLRGIAYLEVFVDGPAGDLHSGSYGGAVTNPALAPQQSRMICQSLGVLNPAGQGSWP